MKIPQRQPKFIVRTYEVGKHPGGFLLTGGTTTAADFNEAADRLASRYPVRLTATGRAHFYNPESKREISLHVLVYPDDAPSSKAKADELRRARALERAVAEKAQDEKDSHLAELLNGIDTDEAIRRLSLSRISAQEEVS